MTQFQGIFAVFVLLAVVAAALISPSTQLGVGVVIGVAIMGLIGSVFAAPPGARPELSASIR